MKYVSALFLSVLFLAGCGEDDRATRNNDFVPLTAITVESQYPVIAAGTSNQFRAIGDFSGRFERDVTAEVTWQVGTGGDGVLQFTDPAGRATAIGAGSTDVTASLRGVSGTLQNFTVADAVIQQVTVTPAAATVANGRQQQFTAEGRFGSAPNSFTQDLTQNVTWAAEPAEVASIDAAGLASGRGTGAANVTATFVNALGSAVGTATLTVTDAVLERVELTPAAAVLIPGETEQFTARAVLSDGSEDAAAPFTWNSLDERVATVSSSGLVTAVAAGQGRISATSGGRSGMATITVATLQSIEITPTTSVVAVNTTLPLQATGTFSDNVSRDLTGEVEWSSGSDTVATVDATGLLTGRTPGAVTITARRGTVTATKTVTVQ